MTKISKRVISVALVVMMLATVFCSAFGCTPKKNAGEYTYKAYTTALGTNWNPHTWETNADDSILSYISSPFVTLTIKDSANGIYQWAYEMATDIQDVTKDHQDDLTKYGVTLQSGKTAETTESGFVFEIKLNPNAKWENGEVINADDYIYSMQQLLNPKMRNYRANLYYNGESAVAGGLAYYNSEAPIYDPVVAPYGEGETPDYSFDITANKVYLNLTATDMTIGTGYAIIDLVDLGYVTEGYDELDEAQNSFGYVEITADNQATVYSVLDQYLAAFGASIYTDDAKTTVNEEYYKEFLYYFTGNYSEKVEYDKVGCYKVDDYTIRYITQTYIDLNYFLTSCTSTWLVYEDLYEAGKTTTGDLITTNYGTSKETSMSYGTYKMDSLQDAKQIVFVQNENWYGWTEEDGVLVSYTTFDVDGAKQRQYQTTKIVIDVMDESAAKQAFLKGELSEWSPAADELSTYASSDQLYQVDETYTMSFFFNTDVDALKTMDAEKGNVNSVVLSNATFRKAMSLAIDRAKFVTATQGYKPAYALMNNLYYYDVYNDPASIYRSTDEAMQAICNLYGVEYGEGKVYATLKDAYQSITGYNLTEAKTLMKTACDELVAAGLYTANSEIKIKVGWAKGALTSDDNKQMSLLNEFVNAALEGSGFGAITFEAVGNIDDRYSAVPAGEYAIGYGAWGGAAFYPFRNFQVYMDPDEYDINEAACWDPKTETLTLNINGQDYTMTWQEWSTSMVGSGQFAEADFETKLKITAKLEEEYLKFYYRIPLCGSTACFMLSYQVSYFTETYNIMYDFGGLRLMKYNYTDAEWAEYVAEQGGTLNYE